MDGFPIEQNEACTDFYILKCLYLDHIISVCVILSTSITLFKTTIHIDLHISLMNINVNIQSGILANWL